MAERCALTTDEQLAKLTTSPEFLAWEKAQQCNAANSGRSWLSWLALQSLRALFVALLLATYIVSHSAPLGIGQPPAPSPHHTGTETPSSLPASPYTAAHDESVAAADQPGDLGEEDPPRAGHLGQELNPADRKQDSGPPVTESQTKAKKGRESEVLSLESSPANDEPERTQDHVSQESSLDAVSEPTHNNHTPSAKSLAAAQRLQPFSATEALWGLWGLAALLKLSTACSMAACWRKTRMRRVTKKQAVKHKETLAAKRTPAPTIKKGTPLSAAQDKFSNLACADYASDKENVPELPRHSDTTILAAKGATNSNLAEIQDLRRQLDAASHAACFWECNFLATTEALQDECQDLETQVARSARDIKFLQERVQDRESRLHQARQARSQLYNSPTVEARLRQEVKLLEGDIQFLGRELPALRRQNTALEARLASAQQASNEMEESDDCSTATEDWDLDEPFLWAWERRCARNRRRRTKQQSSSS